MSRSLGHAAIMKKRALDSSPEADGRRAFDAGLPKEANPWRYGYGRGKGHAWLRGWDRARMAAQKVKS